VRRGLGRVFLALFEFGSPPHHVLLPVARTNNTHTAHPSCSASRGIPFPRPSYIFTPTPAFVQTITYIQRCFVEPILGAVFFLKSLALSSFGLLLGTIRIRQTLRHTSFNKFFTARFAFYQLQQPRLLGSWLLDLTILRDSRITYHTFTMFASRL
jgi:hypothetical protein